MRKIILALTLSANFATTAKAANALSLPELFAVAYADCERTDFLRVASGFPLDSEKMAEIEIAGKPRSG